MQFDKFTEVARIPKSQGHGRQEYNTECTIKVNIIKVKHSQNYM